MEYGLMLFFGVVIGISLMIPIAAAMVKQTEKVYENRVKKLEGEVYGRKCN